DLLAVRRPRWLLEPDVRGRASSGIEDRHVTTCQIPNREDARCLGCPEERDALAVGRIGGSSIHAFGRHAIAVRRQQLLIATFDADLPDPDWSVICAEDHMAAVRRDVEADLARGRDAGGQFVDIAAVRVGEPQTMWNSGK